MKRLYYVLFFCLWFYPLYAQAADKPYEEAFRLIDVWLDVQRDFEKLPSITAIVIEDQKVLWAGAYGYANLEDKTKADVSTIYSICSISKLFTSIAIMKLYDEGKLRLDDRIQDILPSFKLKQKFNGSAPITIRTLLTHSSGLPREADYTYWTGPDFLFPTKQQINLKLTSQETLYPASTYFQYSNLGMALLGEIIEEISGQPYEEYIQQNILYPLGLLDTRPELPAELYGNQMAVGYSAMTREGEREKVKLFQANGMKPAAGFSSNVIDLGKFAAWMFRLRDTVSVEILKSSTLKYMQQVHWTDPDWKITWGLGFSVYRGEDGDTWVGHSGHCPGYKTTLQLDLNKKRAFSVMINADGTNPYKYVEGMSRILNKTETSCLGNKAYMDKNKFQDYIGYYSAMPWWSEEYIGSLNGKLVSIVLPTDEPAGSMIFYQHIKGDIFRRVRDNGDLAEAIVFERDKQGKVFRYKKEGYYAKKIER